MAQKSIILKMTPFQHRALERMAKTAGYPTMSAYLRALITTDAIRTGVGTEAWAETLEGIAYVIMSHNECTFVGAGGTTPHRRGHALKFPTAELANETRLKLSAPELWRIGVVKLQQPVNPEIEAEESART